MRTLLAVYDSSLVHILDSEGQTYQSFFNLIQDKSLTRFAIENYFCAEHLIEMFFVSGSHISRHTDEYPFSRAIVGLFGGVLEAILADKVPGTRGKPLGATEWTFQVDYPVLPVQWPQPGGEDLGLRKKLQVSLEVELAILEGLLKSVDELAAKDFTQHWFGKEVVLS